MLKKIKYLAIFIICIFVLGYCNNVYGSDAIGNIGMNVIHKMVDEWAKSDSGIVDALKKADGTPMSTILRSWRQTVRNETSKLQSAISSGKLVENGIEKSLDATDIEGFKQMIGKYKIIEELMNYAIGDTPATPEEIKAKEQEYIATDTALDRYVVEHYAKVTGTPREPHGSFDDVLDNIGDYEPTVTPVSNEVTGKISVILTIVTNVGIILSVLIPAILGIKYMLGSVEEKADFKSDMIPYLVGAALLFGVCGIVKITQLIGEMINNI